jgi:hypothetical protein
MRSYCKTLHIERITIFKIIQTKTVILNHVFATITHREKQKVYNNFYTDKNIKLPSHAQNWIRERIERRQKLACTAIPTHLIAHGMSLNVYKEQHIFL